MAELCECHAVHRELAQCKKAANESSQKYIYKMLDIAAQANVDTRSVIQYIIDGVQDDAVNKTILYEAKVHVAKLCKVETDTLKETAYINSNNLYQKQSKHVEIANDVKLNSYLILFEILLLCRTKGNCEFGMNRGKSRIYSKTLGGVVEAWKLTNHLFRGSLGAPYHHREYPD
ncbi:hypothetical protein ALC57_17410 [Trachymyrmex cornetzi]|uniref:Uncharacterized protein n=1 Tax=Trachymyrmex cornetzi TaxID=471704 RepID=A0A151ITX5_9HYME|nr:hypothetical protein ALC57_17410 [Trachymyrmex cornetzi]